MIEYQTGDVYMLEGCEEKNVSSSEEHVDGLYSQLYLPRKHDGMKNTSPQLRRCRISLAFR